jgi:hypothetical protein
MSESSTPDFVWGARAIGVVIGQTTRQVEHMLPRGYLPARKIGDKWVASRAKLLAAVSGDESEAAAS